MPELLTETDKRRHLETLSDEVKQFHPFLEGFLKKMVRVQSVYYTHGPNERGADFIVERDDDTTGGEREYVAVIAKTGKIDKNFSSSGILDQIRECQLSRVIPGGRKLDFVHEIWVFTNENISQIGREAIAREFIDRRIKFFEAQNIIPLVDKLNPNYWFNVPVDIGDYLREVDTKLKDQEKALSLINGIDCDLYVDQGIRPIRPKYQSKLQRLKHDKARKTIHEIIVDSKMVVIEAEAGFGKSKLLRYIGRYHSAPTNYIKTKIIPIYFNFTEIHAKLSSAISTIVKDKISTKIKGAELIDSKILVLIDGFDEVRMDEKGRLDAILLLKSEIDKVNNVKLILTSRPLNICDKYPELRNGIDWHEIMPMSVNGMLSFFTSLCKKESISNRLIEDIKKSNIFKQLPKSPIAALLLAKLLEDNSKDLPSNLTELYLKYTELMLGRWDMDRGLQSQKEFDAAVVIITNIAVFFIENNLTYCSAQEAKDFFISYLGKRNLGVDANQLYLKLIERSGIILNDPDNGRISFKHKTFAEFFYASSRIKGNSQNFISSSIYDPYLKNIYFFYVGLQKDCEDVLTEMLGIVPRNESEKYMRVIFMADYLLAGYATPYEFIKKSFETLIKEFSILYTDILSGKIETPFKQNSEIMVLWIFQAMVRSVYGYDFFAKSLNECALNILTDSNLTNNQRAYAAFFISVIGVELKVENPFDGILDSLEGGLPLSVQFGIRYELKNVKNHSRLLNKQDRKLTRYLRTDDMKLRDSIHAMHEVPLDEMIKRREKRKVV